MKRVAILFAIGAVGLLSACGDGGIEFNGVKQVEQFPVRKTPIVHFNLPSESFTAQGDAYVDVMKFLPLTTGSFIEQPSPGHDLWSQWMRGMDLDGNMVEDWSQILTSGFGAAWPDNAVFQAPYPGLGAVPAADYIQMWTLSLANQWFLRDIDGAVRTPVVPNDPPVQYEGAGFSSMPISIHATGQAATPYTDLYTINGVPAQQETTTANPVGVGANGVIRTPTPVSNLLRWFANGLMNPNPFQGLLSVGWWEPPAQNIHIETIAGTVQRVPAPDYFSGGGFIDAAGGIYVSAYIGQWRGVTDTAGGATPAVSRDDGVKFSYYLAVLVCHQIGNGLGLVNSSFALPGVINNQEDIMNESVVMDLTAFIAEGKQFNFVLEDLLRMQDVVNGDFMTPGSNSTLPGSDRQ
ncbi:MAG: hypothetical protein K8I27_14055 [Planctomycetes bacterium]|nr:hypothetical protein [Planctomycetota bacterium]